MTAEGIPARETIVRVSALPETTRQRPIDITYLGVLLFIASEAMFFAGLFAAYFNARATHPIWPPAGVHPEILIPLVLTFVLLTSSFTMQLAVRRISHGDHVGMRRAMLVTIVLGAAFLCGQLLDYSTLGFSFASGPYGAAFFTLTGFHGAHVAAGVVAMSAMLVRAAGGQFSARRHAAIEGVAAYWHFVDVIWLLVFSTIYLLH